MARRIAYRRRSQNHFSMFLVVLVVMMLMVIVAVKSVGLQQKLDMYTAKEQQLQEQLDAEAERAEEIEEFGKYTQTKGYVEKVAKEQLGLLYEDEILFEEAD